MPVITLDGPFLPQDKKEELIRELTRVACEITTIPKEAFVVFIREYAYNSMGQDGITIEEKLKNQPNIKET